MKQTFYVVRVIMIVLLLFGTILLDAEPKSTFKGFVLDEKGLPLVGANVVVKGMDTGAATDYNGSFHITLKPGNYIIEVSFIGYKSVQDSIQFNPGEVVDRNYKLQIEFFKIGGIVVFAERELLPSDAETKTIILAGEIDHIQASSLSDILKLVPGQRFDNPGLQSKKQVSIRTSSTESDADRNAMFGTQIIIDNIPISNNANMQIDTKANTGTVQRTTENSGIDLRQIPADNIEKVEVIRGIPSAKYGDLTSGIIIVKTKSERVDHRFKYKYNLQNKELNVGGGFKLFNQHLSYNLNYAKSVKDIRIEGFDYTRVAGQLSHDTYLFKNLYIIRNRLYYTRTFDEQGLREGDLYLTKLYNRDYIIRFSHNSQYILSPRQRIDINYSFNLNRQNSYRKKLISSDNTYISDRLTEGTQEGQFIQNYISKLWVKGRAYNHYLNIEYNSELSLFDQTHKFVSGICYRLEGNNGPGKYFDPRTPPSINSVFRNRPRKYDDIPDLKITSLYMEDRITGHLGIDYQLNLGTRIEIYGSGNDLLPANHGYFINPRLNFVFQPGENSQIRIGYGATSKSPSLSMLFPSNIYIDVDDINRYTDEDSLRLAVISTYIFPKENPALKGFQQIKRELSYDLKIGKFGFTLTGYSNTVHGGFASTKITPIFLYKYDYPAWPDTTGKSVYDSVYTTFTMFDNTQSSKSRGVEFSVQTKRFSPLDMRLRIEAAYNYTESDKKYYDFGDTYRFDTNVQNYRKPFWNEVNLKSENLLINYKIEFTIKKLGAWVTLEAQQVVFDKDWYSGMDDSLAVGYLTNTGDMMFIPEEDRSSELFSSYRRVYSDYMYKSENKKNIWLFNLRVSKSLFRGTEVSFFVNNIFNDHPLYRRQRTTVGTKSYTRLNPDIFFGVEFSGVVNKLFK